MVLLIFSHGRKSYNITGAFFIYGQTVAENAKRMYFWRRYKSKKSILMYSVM